jgi:hypothetical protein
VCSLQSIANPPPVSGLTETFLPIKAYLRVLLLPPFKAAIAARIWFSFLSNLLLSAFSAASAYRICPRFSSRSHNCKTANAPVSRQA